MVLFLVAFLVADFSKDAGLPIVSGFSDETKDRLSRLRIRYFL